MDKLTYQGSGVDPEKAAGILSKFAQFQKSRPRDPRLLSGIGPFASCFSLKELVAGYEDPILVTSCDGVGTKAKLALDWGSIEGLGDDLVAMNVNDLLCVGASPVLFLDYFACGKLRDEQLSPLLRSLQAACEKAGCSLAGGETAEMPGIYTEPDFDLAGFAVGIVEKKKILGADKVKEGDAVVALASSGPHSNGFSLLRKLVERESIQADDDTPWGKSWMETLLAPTTIYVKALEPHVEKLHALAHITGGGLFENLPRVLGPNQEARIDSKLWELPPLFQWIQEKAKLSTHELLSTVNGGVGMIAILADKDVDAFVKALPYKAWRIGTIARGDVTRVVWG